MKDLRTDEHKLAEERRRQAENQKKARRARNREKWSARAWATPPQWMPIEECPFADYESWDGDKIFVTDGRSVDLITVQKRFGRPRICVGEPELAITDRGVTYIGGEWKEPDWPEWMFEWELKSCTETHFAYGDEVASDIDYTPTHWLPMLPPH